MKMENEITVFVTSSYDILNTKLLEHGFAIKEKYDVDDIYMINKSIDISNLDSLDILKYCILVRNLHGIKKELVYKYKEYDNNGDILNQGKVECPVENIEMAIKYMEAINYKTLFSLHDKCIAYANDKTELLVQIVNDKYIFIEMEQSSRYVNRDYLSIDELKEDINQYDLPIDKSSYFVKKVEIVLKENTN